MKGFNLTINIESADNYEIQELASLIRDWQEEHIEKEEELPRNHGRAWDADQDRELLHGLFSCFCSLDEAAEEMGRTAYAIECRYNHLLPNSNWRAWL